MALLAPNTSVMLLPSNAPFLFNLPNVGGDTGLTGLATQRTATPAVPTTPAVQPTPAPTKTP